MWLFYQLLGLLFIFFVQCLLFFTKGFFLSIEFTLYPYLTSHGLLPYKNLVDQHFPSLFFGAFSLPLFSASSSIPLTILFLALLLATNILLFIFFKKNQINHPTIWVLCYTLVSFYFSGNILWVETFVTLAMVLYLCLYNSPKIYLQVLLGILLSQMILMRPTLIPAIILLAIATKFNTPILIGSALGLSISTGYLLYHQLFSDFWQAVVVFNREVYPSQAKILPSLRQVLTMSLIFVPTFVVGLKNHKYLLLLVTSATILLAYPRFGFEHLQPFILMSFVTLAVSQKKLPQIPVLLTIIFLILNLISISKNTYGNYFYQPNIIKIGREIGQSSYRNLYLFGASDLLYPLSGKLPPHNYYLPSLPWYLNYPEYQKLLLESLNQPDTLILVDTDFSVDGIKLIKSSKEVYEYITINFDLVKQDGNYQYYVMNK